MRRIDDLIEEIRSRKEEISVSPTELKARQEIWGDKRISFIATVMHSNLSWPSRNLVGWYRFNAILKALKSYGLWVIIDDPRTVANEHRRCGGGIGLDFGPFGFFKPEDEIQEKKLEMEIFNFFSNKIKRFPKPFRRLFVQSLAGRIRGVYNNLSGISGILMPGDSLIQVVRLSELLENQTFAFSYFHKKERLDLFRQSGVVHFGNTYQSGIVNEPNFLPDGCNSQSLGAWEWRERQLDISTLHLLYFGVEEYCFLLQKRSQNFLLEVPHFQWEDLLDRWG